MLVRKECSKKKTLLKFLPEIDPDKRREILSITQDRFAPFRNSLTVSFGFPLIFQALLLRHKNLKGDSAP